MLNFFCSILTFNSVCYTIKSICLWLRFQLYIMKVFIFKNNHYDNYYVFYKTNGYLFCQKKIIVLLLCHKYFERIFEDKKICIKHS